VSPRRLVLLGILSLTATGLVIGSALRDNHRSEALAAAVALSRASAVTPAPAATVPAPAAATPAAAHTSHTPSSASVPADTSVPAVETPAPSQPKKKQPAAAPAPTTPTSSSKVKHVFVIALTGAGYDATFGSGAASAPYLNQQLRPQGELLSGYRGLPGAADLPSYIAMVSGQPPNDHTNTNCTTYSAACVYPVATLTLADQLTSAGHTWKGYFEDMDAGPQPVTSCRHPDSDQADPTQQGRPGDEYAARHNPFVYFHSLLDLGDCATNDLPLSKLSGDLASAKTTPSVSFIAPNLCHDGTDTICADGTTGGVGATDAYLSQLVPQILASAAYRKDGLLELVFGSGGALLVSPFISAGGSDDATYDPYSLLRTNEDIFGLSHLAKAGGAKVKSFGGNFVTGAGD
jgi:Phosphoesterase family